MSGHTPGPWKNARTQDGRPVCFHFYPQVSEHHVEPANPEHVANMRLLDAAPDLLEALQAMCAEFRALDLPYGSKAYAQAISVINKVTTM